MGKVNIKGDSIFQQLYADTQEAVSGPNHLKPLIHKPPEIISRIYGTSKSRWISKTIFVLACGSDYRENIAKLPSRQYTKIVLWLRKSSAHSPHPLSPKIILTFSSLPLWPLSGRWWNLQRRGGEGHLQEQRRCSLHRKRSSEYEKTRIFSCLLMTFFSGTVSARLLQFMRTAITQF